ncbi:hypothetical protein RhiJN_10645 [Ceratobasidium sp. AG-Ba]|nr:hypothetical protein RhiJN_10645 [Ceratobasidium sp. AG-Ba]QRW11385.1 hypothetical protein RhiLY_10384 [Ceratobasidium sp. AG-Ba]
MFGNTLIFFTTTLAAVTSVAANHAVSFTNNCGSSIRPIIKNTANGVTYTGPWLAKGQGSSSSVAENWPSGIIVGQTNANQGNDCIGCTRLECDFANSNPSWHCCNLSRVAGFHVGMSFSWTGGGCQGATCNSASCPPSDAWVPNVDDGSSLRFCPAANVGLKVTFCP